MSERTDADRLAERLLDDPNADPDDDRRMLARQLLRRREVVERLEKELVRMQDPHGDLVNANRDTILRIHEQGVAKVKKLCEYVATSLMQSDDPPVIVLRDLRGKLATALKVIEAVNSFHPMHGESWAGWPEGS